jgi:hypothetical protein
MRTLSEKIEEIATVMTVMLDNAGMPLNAPTRTVLSRLFNEIRSDVEYLEQADLSSICNILLSEVRHVGPQSAEITINVNGITPDEASAWLDRMYKKSVKNGEGK